MIVVGLDLSLTSTGIAGPDGPERIRSRGTGMTRLADLRDQILYHVGATRQQIPKGWSWRQRADLVVLEGYAMGTKRQGHSYAVGELGGVIRLAIHETGIPYVDVPPATLKKFATGKGNAGKDEVLAAAIRRLDYAGSSHDEADALWLRVMAHEALGAPLVKLPGTHLEALRKIVWPQIGAAA